MLKEFVYPFVSLFSVSQFACTYIYIYFELMDLRWNASVYEKKVKCVFVLLFECWSCYICRSVLVHGSACVMNVRFIWMKRLYAQQAKNNQPIGSIQNGRHCSATHSHKFILYMNRMRRLCRLCCTHYTLHSVCLYNLSALQINLQYNWALLYGCYRKQTSETNTRTYRIIINQTKQTEE